jgi:hypothetical protein
MTTMMMTGKKVMAAVASTGLLVLTVACTSTTTTEEVPQTNPIVERDDAGKDPNNNVRPTQPIAKEDAGADDPEPAKACPANFFSSSTCQSCFATSCKVECGSCGADKDCDEALTCLSNCTTETCMNNCLTGVPQASLTLLKGILGEGGCLDTKCTTQCASSPAPTKKRTGDACTTGSECETGTCNGRWCSESCNTNVDCGINTSGDLVWCVANNGGTRTCFPGCASNADCAAFSGTTCKAVTATNGASTRVCSL